MHPVYEGAKYVLKSQFSVLNFAFNKKLIALLLCGLQIVEVTQVSRIVPLLERQPSGTYCMDIKRAFDV